MDMVSFGQFLKLNLQRRQDESPSLASHSRTFLRARAKPVAVTDLRVIGIQL